MRTPVDGDADASTTITTAEENPLSALSASELFWLASDCLSENDIAGAIEACAIGCASDPDDPDLAALGAWARAQVADADLERLSVELDEIVLLNEEHAGARYYRALMRRRRGDHAGCVRDLRKAIELAPDHEAAQLELLELPEETG
jgi:hypothetical protein